MIALDLFSGIGGMSEGLLQAGLPITAHYYSEVDKHAIANYSYNFKNSIYVGSVTNVRHIVRTIEAARTRKLVITFGSPCQDFSLAGKRSGLGGDRSSLIKYALFLVRRLRPDIFIWENVKGAYSSNAGADYWAIMQAFANLDGYRCEGQLLNTAWFLPQNRERIYVIGHLAGRSECGVFPITENDRFYNRPGADRKEIYLNNRTALTQQARQYASWNGDFIRVRSATSAGYEEAGIGDSINLSVPNSETRRGRVGKGLSQTLDTQCNQAVYIDEGIRSLTEIECERLQGFKDDWTKWGNYDGVVKQVSKTQRYKMCGNAVSVPVVKAIGERLKLTK